MVAFTVGVMAYNEEQNIAAILHALLKQRLSKCRLVEIVVVASGCSDRTVERAQRVAQAHPVIKVVAQRERSGKASAVNHLMKIAQTEVIAIAGADTLPDLNALENLVSPFEDPSVGMTGARVIPLDEPGSFLGFIVHALWYLHHRLALRFPKLGELVAFRNTIPELPVLAAADEVALEALISKKGLRLVYTPEALVYNFGPKTLRDFLIQRRRIFAGHLHILFSLHYMASSMPIRNILALASGSARSHLPMVPSFVGAIILECCARLLGTLDFVLARRHHIWLPARTTKREFVKSSEPLTLLYLQVEKGELPHHLLRRMHRVSCADGSLIWWDRSQNRALFLLPCNGPKADALEARIQNLKSRLLALNGSVDKPFLSHRVVQFSEDPAKWTHREG